MKQIKQSVQKLITNKPKSTIKFLFIYLANETEIKNDFLENTKKSHQKPVELQKRQEGITEST